MHDVYGKGQNKLKARSSFPGSPTLMEIHSTTSTVIDVAAFALFVRQCEGYDQRSRRYDQPWL